MPRTAVRSWLITLGVVSLLLGGVGLAGGFAPAGVDDTRQLQIGEPVDLGRWQARVEAAELLPGRLRVHFQLTNTGSTTASGPSSQIVAVKSADDWLANDGYLNFQASNGRIGGIGPQLSREAYLEFEVEDAAWRAGDPVFVVLGYEVLTDGGFANFPTWQYSHTLGSVQLSCQDNR